MRHPNLDSVSRCNVDMPLTWAFLLVCNPIPFLELSSHSLFDCTSKFDLCSSHSWDLPWKSSRGQLVLSCYSNQNHPSDWADPGCRWSFTRSLCTDDSPFCKWFRVLPHYENSPCNMHDRTRSREGPKAPGCSWASRACHYRSSTVDDSSQSSRSRRSTVGPCKIPSAQTY